MGWNTEIKCTFVYWKQDPAQIEKSRLDFLCDDTHTQTANYLTNLALKPSTKVVVRTFLLTRRRPLSNWYCDPTRKCVTAIVAWFWLTVFTYKDAMLCEKVKINAKLISVVDIIHEDRFAATRYSQSNMTLENRYGFWPQTGCVTVPGCEAAFLVARWRFPYRSRFNFSVKTWKICYRAMQSAT